MNAQAVPSPCVSICRMNDQSGLCEGCWRTLDEIATWSTMGDEAKRAVWQLIEQRQAEQPFFTAPAP
ncbi:DUF1289 domain-containing protein [Sphaerotilaceae bacterium SBD11-9]